MGLLFVLFTIARHGGILGAFLFFLILPALFRYLMVLLLWRAKGEDAPPLDIDHFQWIGNAWSIFPVLLAVLIGGGLYSLGTRFGVGWAYGVAIVVSGMVPASLAVLAISHSPLESLNPRLLVAVIRRCGGVYWIAPTFLVTTAAIVIALGKTAAPRLLLDAVAFYFLFTLFALIGGVIRAGKLAEEADIPPPIEPDEEKIAGDLLKERTNVLNHAYGFVSRGNRAGGFGHILEWLDRDPDPDKAWAWFFDQMMGWEIKEPALFFAQTYLSHLLDNREYVAAVKLMMRCRLENEAFKPLPEDRALALQAAEQCQNDELVALLRTLL